MTIEMTRTIEAPRERVFRALTEASELERWFVSSAESDPHTGGEYVLRFEFDDPSRNHTYAGRYEEVTPNERVRYPWNGAFGETTVEFSTTQAGARTQLVLRHSGWSESAADSREMHEQGWAFFLDNLERYLAGGDDRRAEAFGQRTTSAGAGRVAGP